MIYHVLLVDDEMPALRYTQSIIEKYAPFFEVCGTCTSSEKALEYLQDHRCGSPYNRYKYARHQWH